MHERDPKGGATPPTMSSGEFPAPTPSVASSKSAAGKPTRTSAKPLRGVLLVESDPDLQWRLSRMLTVCGNRVVGTSSSDGALALIAHWPVDVALIAEDLPGLDGIELARRLHRDHPSVPVILMAEEGPDVELAARTAGASAWLIKPFHKDELDAALARIRPLPSDRGQHASPAGPSRAPSSAAE